MNFSSGVKMRPLSNFNFDSLDTYTKCLEEIERQIRLLVDIINECENVLSNDDREQLVVNIQWLKRFYEAAERNLLQ
jgi:hypothetical protein